MMEELEHRRKDLIRALIDNPLWNEIVKDLNNSYAVSMLHARNSTDRDEIAAEHKCLQRMLGKLTAIANDVRKMESVRKLEKNNG